MSANPQTESAFINHLPREIREAIYLELWRSHGLHQHILYHGDSNFQFCHWPCAIEFEVRDGLQEELEELRARFGVPLGQDIVPDRSDPKLPYLRRLQSQWMNHWPCGELAYDKYGIKAVGKFTTGGNCWNKTAEGDGDTPWSSPYIPMLLSCKRLSEECLQSIYKSTTFIFTDLSAIQMFLGGPCYLPPEWKPYHNSTAPPAFFRYAHHMELSLEPHFPLTLSCAKHDLPGIPRRHEVYDFHWPRLDQFENLQSLKIWIASRSFTTFERGSIRFLGIKQFGLNDLEDLLSRFTSVKSVTISTPLSSRIGPGEGEVKEVATPGVQLYKRGSGDRFHPLLVFFAHAVRGTIESIPAPRCMLNCLLFPSGAQLTEMTNIGKSALATMVGTTF
ncbi:hypothetical protein CMUS01_09341 [Colletotrichum musicola]|uniref:Uncharacterized protein n=1 Tax=Colletotrichum musicola TaxID=2175873 RepID=A0A8H6NBN5_9PEZI|nr:hypothetical protein CMUS01_09341 [Colletotrichum musicola]